MNEQIQVESERATPIGPATQFLAGVRAELPVLLGVAPFGLIYGVSALAAGLPPAAAQSMSFIVFAGSAQFVTTQLLAAGAPIVVIVVTILIVNVRHLLYGASVAPYLQHLPRRWKWSLAYLLTDEAYVVAITHYNKSSDGHNKHWFFLGAGLALWVTWQASTAMGVFLGTAVPPGWPLDFALPLTFIALVVPAIRDRAAAMTALTATVVALVANGLPYKLALVLAAIAGMAVGVVVENSGRRRTTMSDGENDASPGETAGEI